MLIHSRPRLTVQAIKTLVKSGSLKDCSLTFLLHRVSQTNMEQMREIEGIYVGCPVQVVKEEREMGTGDLRNLVIEKSEKEFGRGDYIYLSDNDVAHLDGWLPTLIDRYEWAENFYGFRAMGAYCHPFSQPVELFDGCYSVNHLTTQSWLMRWSTYDQFGRFCSTPAGKVCQSEDVAYSNKIREAGYRVGSLDPPKIVNTGISNSFGQPIPGADMVRAQAPPGVLVE
jgi:hypothetical protein